MSGICGWYDPSPGGSDRPGDAQLMLAGLNDADKGDVLEIPGGALCSRGAGTWQALDSEAGVATVIGGDPRWSSEPIRRLADDLGNAQALLAAYRNDPDNFASSLSGRFAFALIDYGNRRAAIAVDRLGVRPLCFARTPSGGIAFGSTTASVLGHPSIQAVISDESIYRYFYFHVVPSPATIFERIHKLEPAEIVQLDGKETKRRFHWQPAPLPERSDDAALLDALRRETQQAVARTNPDERTGCFLSGGLDSSTISGLANELTEQPMRAYTIGFDQQGFDETTFARAAAKHFGLEHVEYYVTPDDVAESFDLLSTSYDEPFGNSSAIPAYFCARRAREDGITRLLAGDGGDELFGGNDRYATQKLFEVYHGIPRVLRSGLVEPLTKLLPTGRPALLRKVRRYVEQARIRMPDRLQTYNFLEMFAKDEVFEPDFCRRIDLDTPIMEMREWYERSEGFGFLDRMLVFDWKLTLADNDIRKVNRMCEAAGVGVEYPLMDDELVDFSLTLPASLKLRGSNLRYGFRTAFTSYLPNAVLEKDKHGFGLPFGEWLKSSPVLRDRVLPCVERFRERGILRQEFIDDILHRHATEHATYYGNMLWLIAVADNWLAANVDSNR